jgi:hypothetical protein
MFRIFFRISETKKNGNEDVFEYFEVRPSSPCISKFVATMLNTENSNLLKSDSEWPRFDIFR